MHWDSPVVLVTTTLSHRDLFILCFVVFMHMISTSIRYAHIYKLVGKCWDGLLMIMSVKPSEWFCQELWQSASLCDKFHLDWLKTKSDYCKSFEYDTFAEPIISNILLDRHQSRVTHLQSKFGTVNWRYKKYTYSLLCSVSGVWSPATPSSFRTTVANSRAVPDIHLSEAGNHGPGRICFEKIESFYFGLIWLPIGIVPHSCCYLLRVLFGENFVPAVNHTSRIQTVAMHTDQAEPTFQMLVKGPIFSTSQMTPSWIKDSVITRLFFLACYLNLCQRDTALESSRGCLVSWSFIQKYVKNKKWAMQK